MIKITLDTNCIINMLDHTSPSATSVEELSEIIRYAFEGDVNLAITTRVQADLMNDKDEERGKELIKRLGAFPVIGTIARLDMTRLDSGDVLGGEDHQKLEEELKNIIFPGLDIKDAHYRNKIIDIDHLIGHRLDKRDIFITDDKAILKKAEVLKNSPGIVVMSPKTGLEYLNLNASKLVLVQEFLGKFNEYHQILKESIKSGDYSSHQERFTELRQWLLRKYPLIKDGLLQFKLNMLSVPAGGGQLMYDRSVLLGLQTINERIQTLITEPNLRQQVVTILRPLSEYEGLRSRPGTDEQKLNERFLDLFDLLASYSGYLEKF